MFNKYFLTSAIKWHALMAIFLLMILSQAVQAQVYRCEKESGNIVFSDEPCAKGETSTRLDWLKANPATKKKKSTATPVTTANKPVKKARKNNDAYVVLSLMTTTKLELETASLRSAVDDEKTEAPELVLPDGITVDLLMVDKMIMTYRLGKDKMQIRFIMEDGYEEVKTIHKPFPVLTGKARIGRFSKSLEDIKVIEFFNSEKLRRARGDKIVKRQKPKKSAMAVPKVTKKDVPVIELDLSDEVAETAPVKMSRQAPIENYDLGIKKPSPVPSSQQESTEKLAVKEAEKRPMASTENKKQPVARKPLQKQKQAPLPATHVPVLFVNDKKASVLRATLSSSKGDRQSKAGHFMLSDQEQIPFDKIRTIRVMPTADRSKLVVAVALKDGETRMENMLPPFTRVAAKTDSGAFSHSLLEIRSISLQR